MKHKYYRVFISSVGRLLGDERALAHNILWQKGFIPVSMEGFHSHNGNPPINVIIDHLDQSDFVVMIISYLYGLRVQDLECNQCPVTSVCNRHKSDNKCSISYTHFEYLYSVKTNKLIWCIINKNYSSIYSLVEHAEKIKLDKTDIDRYSEVFKNEFEDNKSFVEMVSNKKYRYEYSTINELEKRLEDIAVEVLDIKNQIRMRGLMECDGRRNRINISTLLEDVFFDFFTNQLRSILPSRPDSKSLEIRCVIARYTEDGNRFTIFEKPRKPSINRKMRYRNQGVIGIMNKHTCAVLHDFISKKTYIKKRNKVMPVSSRGAGTADDCMFMLATPIKLHNTGDIYGAMTFDFEIIKEFYSEINQDDIKLQLLSLVEEYGVLIQDLLIKGIDVDLDFMEIKSLDEYNEILRRR